MKAIDKNKTMNAEFANSEIDATLCADDESPTKVISINSRNISRPVLKTHLGQAYPHLYIPTELCTFVFKNKFIRPMQLYVFLKSLNSGKLKITEDLKSYIGDEIGLRSRRAVGNNLKLLIDRNWVGFCNHTGYYFIRSFERVKEIEGLKKRTAAEFYLKDIKKAKAFFFAAVISKLVNQQKWWERGLERSKGRSIPGLRNCHNFYPVANKAISKILNVSISTAFELKRIATKAGYLEIKKMFAPVLVGHYSEVKAMYKNQVKAANPEMADKIRVKGKWLYIQKPDMIFPKIRLKRKGKKSKHS